MLDPEPTAPASDEPESPTKKTRVSEFARGRNATALAEKNPFDFDSRIFFNEAGHKYTVDGVVVTRSATALIKEAFVEEPFDGAAIAAKNLPSWREGRGNAKYQNAIQGLEDEAAIAAVVEMWNKDTKLGTMTHKYAELSYNGLFPDGGEFAEVEAEGKQFEAFRQLTDLTIVRTEFSLFYVNSFGITICGQADFLFRDTHGKPVIVDLKRTSHNLAADARGGNAKLKFPTTTIDNKFHRYSMQNCIYSVMYTFLTGEQVDELYLLQIHSDRSGFALIKCCDLRREARELLEGVR